MKGFRSTWILMVLVAGLAAYTYYEFKNAERDAQESSGQRPAVEIAKDKITEIKLTHKGGMVHLRKDNGVWSLIEPVQDLAEPATVDGFLFSLGNQKFRELEADANDAQKFGLDQPLATVRVSGEGRELSFEVGSKKAFDGSYYVRQNGKILLGDSGLASMVEREAGSFRSRKIWREEGADIERIQAVSDFDKTRETFTLSKKEGQWTMEPSPSFELDSAKVQSWVTRVTDLMPNEFVKEGIGNEERTEYIFKKPSLVVTLNFKKKDGTAGEWKLTLGQDKAEDVFLHTDQRPTIYKTSASSLNSIRVPKEYFRSGTKPFDFPVEQGRRLEIQTPKLKQTFVKEGDTWKAATDGVDLQQDKLVQLVQDLRALEAQEFVGKNAGKGFPSTPQVVIKDKEGSALLTLSWGDEYKPKQAYNQGRSFRYVKTNLSPDVMGVPKEKLDRLIDEGIVKKNPEPK